MESSKKYAEAYFELFKILRDSDLFAPGPKHKVDSSRTATLHRAIATASLELPGLYQDSYVSPLLRNLESTKARCTPATMEILTGAILDHTHPDKSVVRALQGILALISNVYRSFLTPDFMTKQPLPRPKVRIPSLAMFRPKLDLDDSEFAPHIIPADEVECLSGAKVGVACIPSNYRKHPVLCWAALAHEVGGHDTLHAYDGLLWELKYRVRQHFYMGQEPSDIEPEHKDQFLGLLWDYWTEEAVSDVCAILNLGPAYAMGVAVYLAALNERIRRGKVSKQAPGPTPLLTSSWPPPSDDNTGADIDPHPTDLLKFHVMIGAINALRGLGDQDKKRHVKQIEDIISYTLEANGSDLRTISISGWLQVKAGRWFHIKSGAFPVDRAEMEDGARKIGGLIASECFDQLNGNSLQDLETWDSSDQVTADKAKDELLKIDITDPDPEKIKLMALITDDAQLLAASIMALYERPTTRYYNFISEILLGLQKHSFEEDPVWGNS